MFESIFVQGILTSGNVLTSLGMALVLGITASFCYMKMNVTTRSFAWTIALLPMITATVIMVVNGNLGAGIAVAGSFSMIRFRSVQGNGQEILVVFLAAALGLCLGAGYVGISCLLLVLFLASMVFLNVVKFGAKGEGQQELRIAIPESLDYEGLFDDLLSEYLASYELEQVRTIEMGTAYQLIYRVFPKEASIQKAFLDAVRERNGNLPVSIGKIPETREFM